MTCKKISGSIMNFLKASVFLIFSIFSAFSNASCFGSPNSYTCNDLNSGNSYNVQKIGNTTLMNGFNPYTGSNWSQNSQTYGNITQIQGQTNGNPWNQTIQHLPSLGTTIYQGTNSQGHFFQKTCNQFGCF